MLCVAAFKFASRALLRSRRHRDNRIAGSLGMGKLTRHVDGGDDGDSHVWNVPEGCQTVDSDQ